MLKTELAQFGIGQAVHVRKEEEKKSFRVRYIYIYTSPSTVASCTSGLLPSSYRSSTRASPRERHSIGEATPLGSPRQKARSETNNGEAIRARQSLMSYISFSNFLALSGVFSEK